MKKILFAGASGYGNIGDESYKIVIQKYLGNDYELAFDSPYPDEQMVAWADEIVIGGGGLIYANESHIQYMTSYIQDKPFSFFSCGVQIEGEIQNNIEIAKQQMTAWVPFLDKAKFITVRSPSCLQIIKSVTTNQNLHYFPDIGYLTPEAGYDIIPRYKNIIIITDSTAILPEFQAMLEKIDDPYFLCFSRDDIDITTKLSQKYTSSAHHKDRIRISPQEAVSCLKYAKSVITGRFHGYVLARAIGVENEKITVLDQRYKSLVEDHKQDIGLAIKHFDILKQNI